MIKKLSTILLALFAATTLSAQSPGTPIPLQKVIKTPPDDGPNPRSPELVPVLYLDGYTLTASDNTLGATIQLMDEDDNVVFSTYVYVEGDIALPTTLEGTFTIKVIRGDDTFVGEIEF